MAKPITIELTAILEVASNSKNWNFSVTGIWGKAVAHEKGRDRTSGYLFLFEHDGIVEGVSTTQGSVWSGTFSESCLKAEYVNEFKRKGAVEMTLSEDGADLEGKFWAIDGLSSGGGVYTAHRSLDINREEVVAHLKKRLGSRVVIR
ncbi:MAG: hypothetical protein ACI8RZ_007236 [Myxococcota bacterium]|jgi:hypothetical protein